MSDIETLIPIEKTITVNGKAYTVKKLSLTQNIKMLRLIGSMQESARSKILADVESGKGDMAALLEAIVCENLPGLIGILLDSKDDFSGMTLEEFSELAAAMTELNDFEKIAENFQKAAGNLKGIIEKIKKLLSPPSSEK